MDERVLISRNCCCPVPLGAADIFRSVSMEWIRESRPRELWLYGPVRTVGNQHSFTLNSYLCGKLNGICQCPSSSHRAGWPNEGIQHVQFRNTGVITPEIKVTRGSDIHFTLVNIDKNSYHDFVLSTEDPSYPDFPGMEMMFGSWSEIWLFNVFLTHGFSGYYHLHYFP